jgi:hypothetical protein
VYELLPGSLLLLKDFRVKLAPAIRARTLYMRPALKITAVYLTSFAFGITLSYQIVERIDIEVVGGWKFIDF